MQYILTHENAILPEQQENKMEEKEKILLAQKVLDQEEFQEKWNAFNLTSAIPEVDWENKAVLFVGTEESGSCPNVMEGIEVNTEENSLLFDFKDYEGACTADAVPRTFVIELERDVLKEVRHIRVNETAIAIW